MVIKKNNLILNVPPTAKGVAVVVLSCELPTYQLASVAQSQAASHFKTQEKLRVLGNVPETGIVAVRFS